MWWPFPLWLATHLSWVYRPKCRHSRSLQTNGQGGPDRLRLRLMLLPSLRRISWRPPPLLGSEGPTQRDFSLWPDVKQTAVIPATDPLELLLVKGELEVPRCKAAHYVVMTEDLDQVRSVGHVLQLFPQYNPDLAEAYPQHFNLLPDVCLGTCLKKVPELLNILIWGGGGRPSWDYR